MFVVFNTNINKNVESSNSLPLKEIVRGGGGVRNYMQFWMDIDLSSK